MLKNLRKIIPAVCILAFLLSLPFGAYAFDNTEKAESANELLAALEITDSAADNYDRTVTRAEFCNLVSHVIKTSGMVKTYYYSDVPANHDYADAVYSLSELGIVNGDEDGRFSPDKPITVNQAAAVLVKALNYYRTLAQPVTYPVSYTSKAGQLKLFNGIKVSGDTELSFGEVCIILENTLSAETAVFNDDEVNTDYTVLERYFDLKKGRGICTADDLTALSGSKPTAVGKNQIEIDNEIYGLTYKSAREFIGRRIDYYYNSDGDVLYARPYNNEIISIDYDNVSEFTTGYVRYFEKDNGKEKLASLISGADVIYNGVSYPDYAPKEFDFSKCGGTVTLIDNDGARGYDCVIIEEFTTYVVTYADSESKTLYYSNYRTEGYDQPGTIPERSVSFDDADNLEIVRADGAAVPFDQLFANDAASVFKSRDGSYAKIIVSPAKTNGKITAVNDDTLTMAINDGTVGEFKIDCRDILIRNTLKAGFSGEFILNFKGEICGVVNYYGEEFTYGYLIKSYILDESDGEDMRIKLLSSDGSIGVYAFTDKTRLDGVKYSDLRKANEKLTAYDAKGGSYYTVQQLVRYKLSSDGKLTYLDTAEVGKGETTDNSLEMIYLSDTDNKYRPNNRYVNRKLVIDQAGLVVFCVPRVFSGNPSDIKNAEDSDYYVKYDLKGYYTKENIRIDAAVTDKDGGSSSCVVFPQGFSVTNRAGGNQAYESRGTYFYGIVDSIGEGLNADGEAVPLINLITDTDVVAKECKYEECVTKPIYNDSGAETQSSRALQRGDAVKCFTDDSGIIRYTQTLYDVSREDNGRFSVPALTNVASDSFSCGVIYSKSSKAMKMMKLLDGAPKFDKSNALSSFNKDDYAVQTCAETTTLYYVYDSESDTVRKGTANDIKDYVNNPSNPSVVYQREAYTIPKAVFIYN